jgi:hypothetical protein
MVIGTAEVASVSIACSVLPLSYKAMFLRVLATFKLASLVRVSLVDGKLYLGEASMCSPMKGTMVIRRIEIAKRNNTLKPGMILILALPTTAPFRC